MKNYFNKRMSLYCILLCSMATMFFYIFNPQKLYFEYGSGGGQYADRVDSYSEDIVRNTIKRNILSDDGLVFLHVIQKRIALSSRLEIM